MTKTITQLTEDTSPAAGDFIPTWDTSASATKKATVQNISTATNPYKFSAYRSAAQNATTGPIKINFEVEQYDTGSNYDSSTNYRFTAPVAGYYNFIFSYALGSLTSGDYANTWFYKNGSSSVAFSDIFVGGSNGATHTADMLLAANDYVEVYISASTTRAFIVGTPIQTFFQGKLISKA